MDLVFQEKVAHSFQQIQNSICQDLVTLTLDSYQEDRWDYAHKGGGITRVWSEGKVFEKGGVNFSAIHGESLPEAAATKFKIAPSSPFFATGVSIVFHPVNPYLPTIHMNIRYFEVENLSWFGGGIDLTPYYPEESQVIAFHQGLKKVCDAYDKEAYSKFKKNCDSYFYLKHREEMRGVGGIFFDHLQEEREKTHSFVLAVGDEFVSLYRPFILANQEHSYTEKERAFQLYRRGRYVEFNLIYDRGTLFGLQSGGRVESILMSLPPVAHWEYNWKAAKNSREARLTNYFLKPRDWVATLAEE